MILLPASGVLVLICLQEMQETYLEAASESSPEVSMRLSPAVEELVPGVVSNIATNLPPIPDGISKLNQQLDATEPPENRPSRLIAIRRILRHPSSPIGPSANDSDCHRSSNGIDMQRWRLGILLIFPTYARPSIVERTK